jgi:hypothetical protein
VYKKVAGSGGVVIEKQGFSIVDTHEPAIAMPLHAFLQEESDIHISLYRNQIFPVGRHQGVRLFVSPGLHHITSVSSHCGMSRNERHTSIRFGLFLPSRATIVFHQQAFRMVIYWNRYPRAARRWWRCEGRAGDGGDARAVLEMVGRSDEGLAQWHALWLIYLRLCWLPINAACEFLLNYN